MNFKTKFWPNRSEKYDMGLWSVIALGIGSVVGAGIFALLGQVIMSAGYWTYGAFAVAGTAAVVFRVFVRGAGGALSRCRRPDRLFSPGLFL